MPALTRQKPVVQDTRAGNAAAKLKAVARPSLRFVRSGSERNFRVKHFGTLFRPRIRFSRIKSLSRYNYP